MRKLLGPCAVGIGALVTSLSAYEICGFAGQVLCVGIALGLLGMAVMVEDHRREGRS